LQGPPVTLELSGEGLLPVTRTLRTTVRYEDLKSGRYRSSTTTVTYRYEADRLVITAENPVQGRSKTELSGFQAPLVDADQLRTLLRALDYDPDLRTEFTLVETPAKFVDDSLEITPFSPEDGPDWKVDEVHRLHRPRLVPVRLAVAGAHTLDLDGFEGEAWRVIVAREPTPGYSDEARPDIAYVEKAPPHRLVLYIDNAEEDWVWHLGP
jgi:hypothetical protein